MRRGSARTSFLIVVGCAAVGRAKRVLATGLWRIRCTVEMGLVHPEDRVFTVP